MFKPNPKAQVELKFVELFGRGRVVKSMGRRISPDEARRSGLKCTSRDGLYVTELFVDGLQFATAADRDWRVAYKKLKIELEKLYADGSMVQS